MTSSERGRGGEGADAKSAPRAQAKPMTRSVRSLAFARIEEEPRAEWILPPSAETSPIAFATRDKVTRGASPLIGAPRGSRAPIAQRSVAPRSSAPRSSAPRSAMPGSRAPSVAAASFQPKASGSAAPAGSKAPRSASPSARLRASLLPPNPTPSHLQPGLDAEEVEATPDEIAAAKEAFAQAIVDLAAESARQRMTLIDDSVKLALSIAEIVIEDELRARPELHSKLVRAAMATLDDAGAAKVRASRESYEAILETFGGPRVDAGNVKVEVSLDESLEGLGVVIEHGDTKVDGRIATRLESIARALQSVSKAEAA